jgi:hypothetical protein
VCVKRERERERERERVTDREIEKREIKREKTKAEIQLEERRTQSIFRTAVVERSAESSKERDCVWK